MFVLGLASAASHAVTAKSVLRLQGRDAPRAILSLQSSEYVSSGQAYFREGAEGSNNSLSLGMDDGVQWRDFRAHLKFRDEYSHTERWNYFNLHEAYASWQPERAIAFSVGRKLERWTEWEGEWTQGLFQPRYMQNRLRPEFAGLTGAFYSQTLSNMTLTAGFLPLHIPDLGARFSVEDDKFVSRNPWFNPPAAQFVFREVTGDIRYSLDRPEASEVVNHPGGIAKAEFSAGRKYLARFSGAYKPMPQFLLGFPSRNRVFVTAEEDHMSVRVTPRLAYHTLLGHDSVLKLGSWTAAGSVVREIPHQEGSPEEFTAQQAVPAWITALSFSRALEAEGPNAARVRLGFFKVQGGDAPDRGDFATGRTLFEPRYHFNEAYLLAFTKPWRGWLFYPVESELRLVFDRLQNGGVASFSTGLQFSRNFRADFEVDFLGLLAGPAETEDGFLALYRANDRIGLGLSYVY